MPHSILSFSRRSMALLAYRQLLPFSRSWSLLPCLLQCTWYIVSLNTTPVQEPCLRHLVWILGGYAWVQLLTYFTIHKFRITPTPNTCFSLATCCSDSFRHFLWQWRSWDYHVFLKKSGLIIRLFLIKLLKDRN